VSTSQRASGSDDHPTTASLTLEFCGEVVTVPADRPFTIGRTADFSLDESGYLHRRFLELRHDGHLWWVRNVGAQLAATLSDPASGLHAWLTPQAAMPLVFARTVVRFTAGPTNYELEFRLDDSPYVGPRGTEIDLTAVDGEATTGRVELTAEQRSLIVALAEPVLRRGGSGMTEIPSSADAAKRLGWATTKFNRKLDHVCAKFERAGVRGMHGGPGVLATNRRARLVEIAVGAGIVTAEDLATLDRQ
jgi:hypothetical protein